MSLFKKRGRRETATNREREKCDEREKFCNFRIPHVFISNNIVITYLLCAIIAPCTPVTCGLPGIATSSSEEYSLGSRPDPGMDLSFPYHLVISTLCRDACTETATGTSDLHTLTVPLHKVPEGVEHILHHGSGVMQGSRQRSVACNSPNNTGQLDLHWKKSSTNMNPVLKKVKGESVCVDQIKVQRERPSKCVAKRVNRSVASQMSISQVNNLIEQLRKESIGEEEKAEVTLLVCKDCPYNFTSYSRPLLAEHIEAVHGAAMRGTATKKNKRKTGPDAVKPDPKLPRVDDSIMVLSQPLAPLLTSTPAGDSQEDQESLNLLNEESNPSQDPLGEREETEDEDEEYDEDGLELDDYSQVIESEQEDPNHSVNRMVMKNEPIEEKDDEKYENPLTISLRLRIDALESELHVRKAESRMKIRNLEEESKKANDEKHKLSANHCKELAKLLDEKKKLQEENKKLQDRNKDQKESLNAEFRKTRDRQKERENKQEDEKKRKEKEKEKRARTKCRNADNEGGCAKNRCEFFHPTDHCQKFLGGGGCLSHLCKKLHQESERRRLRSIRNTRKRIRSENSPPFRSNRKKIENDQVCKDWNRTGRCRSFSTGALGCREGSHPQRKKDFPERAAWRAGTKSRPENWTRGTSR